MRTRARGVILPIVMFVLVLLGLLAAMFSFRVHADLSSTQAIAYRLQTRLAAEAGVERVKLLLRTGRFDRTLWYNNPELFHRVLVWAQGEDARAAGTTEEFKNRMAFRFSIVADDPTDDEDYIRFGITDEASKLNLNTANETQLLKLVSAVIVAKEGDEQSDPQAIVDAILDWRDPDSTAKSEAGDTEGVYYLSLEKPYRVRNGPFDTVEELLLVKGVTGEVLFGEDFDRNGLLTANEDDGDRSFPLDNQDGVLNRGLFPYLTTFSSESNVSNDNRPRAYLLGDQEALKAELESAFPDEPDIVEYILLASHKPTGGGKPPGGSGAAGSTPPASGTGPKSAPPTTAPGPKGGSKPPPAGDGTTLPPGSEKGSQGSKLQQQNPAVPGGPRRPSGGQSGSSTASPPAEPDPGQGEPVLETGDELSPEDAAGDGTEQEGEKPPGDAGTGDGGAATTPIRCPASLMLPRTIGGQVVESPLTPDHLVVLMDRTTTEPPGKRELKGLININTAPRLVLECVDGFTGEQIDALLAARDALDPRTSASTAWLVAEGIVDVETFEKVAPAITARGQQFTIESLGYADHIGMVTRLQVVVDMKGPIAQTIYYRDVSYLGGSYPIREEDKEKVRGR